MARDNDYNRVTYKRLESPADFMNDTGQIGMPDDCFGP